jgi:hypothetical protein
MTSKAAPLVNQRLLAQEMLTAICVALLLAEVVAQAHRVKALNCADSSLDVNVCPCQCIHL